MKNTLALPIMTTSCGCAPTPGRNGIVGMVRIGEIELLIQLNWIGLGTAKQMYADTSEAEAWDFAT